MTKTKNEADPALTDQTDGQAATVAPAPVQPEFTKAVNEAVAAYLDANLADLVAAAMPETPEQQAQRERESYEEAAARQAAAAARKARAAQKAEAKAEADAVAKRAERAEQAAKAFAQAEPFTGSIADIKPGIVRGIVIDNGTAYNPDLRIDVRPSELEPLTDGSGLLLTKAIDLPARGAEFTVQGVSLVTDAGVLRIALNGSRKCGGGKGVQFPARSLLFRPAAPRAAEETGAGAE